MKKWIGLLLAVTMLFALAACGSQNTAAGSQPEAAGSAATEPEATASKYGDSQLYTPSELEAAADAIVKEFDSWECGELLSLQYGGDDANTQENIDWLNLHEAADPARPFTQCAKFVSDFHTSPDAEGGFNQDSDYTDWQWFLGRSEGGDWVLVDWGY